MVKLVALYLCSNSCSKRSFLIANLISKISSHENGTSMDADRFVAAIKDILRFCTISFTKAVFETVFMGDLYDDSDYMILEFGIE